MWETNSQFPTQLSSAKIYANIGTIEVDLNVGNPPTDDYMSFSLPYTEHYYGSNDPISLFNSSPIGGNTFIPLLTHMQQYGGPSMYHIS